MQDLARMRELIARLTAADTAYYKHDAPILSDRDYDALYAELLELERHTGVTLSGSPTRSASGEVLEGLKQVRHSKAMLSAQKTKSVDEVIRFVGGHGAVFSWKLDGLTLVLRYQDGTLAQALTRGGGGGTVGEDVTHTVRVMRNVPLTIPSREPFEVRGEGVIGWENFKRLNDGAEESYAHPRNLAAGGIRRLDANRTKAVQLEFFAFELISGGAETSKSEQLRTLERNGFDVAPYKTLPENTPPEVLRETVESFRPRDFGYPADGLMVEYDDLSYGQSLGATGHHENRLLAFKWEDELFETVFLGLETATTRTGMVSLTAMFEDVNIDGTTVNRAYLHNLDNLDRLALGAGDRIQVYKANQIIPQIAENLTRSGTLPYPETCPRCGAETAVRASESGTRLLFCENPDCPARLVRRFVHFCGKSRMDIPDLSEKRLEVFIASGWVQNFGDLYELPRHREAFLSTPGFGEKLFERLTRTLEQRRSCTLYQLLAGLGIPNVGNAAARTLSSAFGGDWDAFETALQEGYDFTGLPDFGQTLHDNLYAWYADEEEAKLWRPVLQHLSFVKEERSDTAPREDNPFFGKTVVATGKLEHYTRESIEERLRALGAKPGGSVSKNTGYVIAGENAGSKRDKARQLGVPVLTEAEFEAMAGFP